MLVVIPQGRNVTGTRRLQLNDVAGYEHSEKYRAVKETLRSRIT